jgi:UDP-2,3-diacylglucosamine hydrolase
LSRVYFISDAHLGLGTKEHDREKESRLIEFLSFIEPKASELYIVGDLFDAWIEYRSVIPKGHHRLFTKLEDLTRKGIAVHFLVGNHDFWMRDFFEKELGVHLYREPIETVIDGKRFYIHHGDGLALNDLGYRILKKILRNPVSIWLYTWVHPDIGYGIARTTSQKSRAYTSDKDYGEADGMSQAAKARIEGGDDFVIMGHRHKPHTEQIGKGMYFNLGDWITYNTYVEAIDGKAELKTWQTAQNQ